MPSRNMKRPDILCLSLLCLHWAWHIDKIGWKQKRWWENPKAATLVHYCYSPVPQYGEWQLFTLSSIPTSVLGNPFLIQTKGSPGHLLQVKKNRFKRRNKPESKWKIANGECCEMLQKMLWDSHAVMVQLFFGVQWLTYLLSTDSQSEIFVDIPYSLSYSILLQTVALQYFGTHLFADLWYQGTDSGWRKNQRGIDDDVLVLGHQHPLTSVADCNLVVQFVQLALL